jgi:glucose/arabinose dehydrogenase
VRTRTIFSTIAALAIALAAVGVTPSPATAASVPANFTDASVASLSRPTAVEWLPNDRIVVLQQGGAIRVGTGQAGFTTAITLNVCSNSERGVLGFTHDPGFLSNGIVYVYYTRPSGGTCVNRVSSFRMSGTTIDPASEILLLDNISSAGGNHNGGDLDVGSDGFLYVSVGDAGTDPRGNSGSAGSNDAAQDLSLLNGKILRITRAGQPAPGNPFSGPGTAACRFRGNSASTPTSTCREIYAWGVRNPFRFAFDRNDGSDRFFINDVGQTTFEEVNEGVLGADYGWPGREGSCPQGQTSGCTSQAGKTDPVTSYGRSLGTFITAGAFVPNGLWPDDFDGSYLFADGGSGRIRQRQPNGTVDYNNPFATNAFGIVDMTFGFDASGRMVLYYVQAGGALRVISSLAPLRSPAVSGLRMIPIDPFRAYDTNGIGVAAGDFFNGTTRVVDLDPPSEYAAALVNITIAGSKGQGLVRTWIAGGERPRTSSVNVDRSGSFVANSAIVPLAPDGTFMLEASTTARIVVDVMAWFDDASGSVSAGRYIGLPSSRLVDTRIPTGTTLSSGSSNPWTQSGARIDIETAGLVGVPADGTVDALVASVVAVADPDNGGFIGAHATGADWSGNSNVNVLAGDVRSNLVVVPLGTDSKISLQTLNIDAAIVDVLGYITSESADPSVAGLYSSIEPLRTVDSRIFLGFGLLGALTPDSVVVPGAAGAATVVQTLTVTQTSAAGWLVALPDADGAGQISNVNFTGPGQTRATLSFTELGAGDEVTFVALVPTHVVADAIGFFSG